MPKKKFNKKKEMKYSRSIKKPSLDQPKRSSGRKNIQLLKGMKDILPADQGYWSYLQKEAEKLAGFYGYGRISTPVLEMTELFRRGVGNITDIVEKEMYSFTDLSGDSVTLRPEGTVGVARAYMEHGMMNQPQPIKFYYWEPMFRHENPQTGRYRQHYQFGFEVIGEENPAVDAEIIYLTTLFYKEIGIETNVQINSIGCPECRAEYKKNLIAYYRRKKKQICKDCQKRLLKNPMRLLDCKEEGCQEVKEEAPQIVDWLCENCKKHFMKVLEYLDNLEVPYNLNHSLVRGLDYYTRTVFEIMSVAKEDDDSDRRQKSLCGGGRYDGLMELIGGRPTPGCGVGIGIERAILEMRKQGIEPQVPKAPQIFLAQIGEQAKQKAFHLLESFRKEKMPIYQMLAKDSLKGQLEIADKLGVKYVLILGQKEVLEGTVLLRD
ncbi:MAG: histidine--tRNA ligase, partial [Patescibacteria group bacterium]